MKERRGDEIRGILPVVSFKNTSLSIPAPTNLNRDYTNLQFDLVHVAENRLWEKKYRLHGVRELFDSECQWSVARNW